MHFHWDDAYSIVSLVSAALGAALSALLTFIVKIFNTSRRVELAEVTKLLKAAEDARAQTFEQAQNISADLQRQIFDLRQQMIKLQEDNLICARENGELRTRVEYLTQENDELKSLVQALRTELEELKLISGSTA